MAEVWEETWHVDETGRMIRDDRDYRIAETIELDIPPREYANAKLAAAAPEMARLLLELEDFEGAGCVACGHVSCGDEQCKDHEPHPATCPIVATLRKAGVLRHGEEP